MAMPAGHMEWTVEMLDALPDDGQRYEIIDGELFVTPAPSDVHHLVIRALRHPDVMAEPFVLVLREFFDDALGSPN